MVILLITIVIILLMDISGYCRNLILRECEDDIHTPEMGIWELLQPHFWKSVRMTPTLPKWGLGSLGGLSKLQSWIAGVKTPRIGVFFISLESYESVDVENELAWDIWTFAAQVMCQRRAGSQIGSLTPEH